MAEFTVQTSLEYLRRLNWKAAAWRSWVIVLAVLLSTIVIENVVQGDIVGVVSDVPEPASGPAHELTARESTSPAFQYGLLPGIIENLEDDLDDGGRLRASVDWTIRDTAGDLVSSGPIRFPAGMSRADVLDYFQRNVAPRLKYDQEHVGNFSFWSSERRRFEVGGNVSMPVDPSIHCDARLAPRSSYPEGGDMREAISQSCGAFGQQLLQVYRVQRANHKFDLEENLTTVLGVMILFSLLVPALFFFFGGLYKGIPRMKFQ